MIVQREDAINLLYSPDHDVFECQKAIEFLGQPGDLEAAKILVEIGMKDEWLVIAAYGSFKSAFKKIGFSAGPIYTKALVLGKNNQCFSQLLTESLQEINYKNSVETYARILRDSTEASDIGRRSAAIKALGESKSDFAIRILSEYLGKGDPSEHYDTLWALYKLNAISALREALRHHYDWIGEEAERLLNQISSPEAKEALKYRLNRQRIQCWNCPMPHAIQFPLDQEVESFGKVGFLSNWDLKLKCSFCGQETGVKFKNLS